MNSRRRRQLKRNITDKKKGIGEFSENSPIFTPPSNLPYIIEECEIELPKGKDEIYLIGNGPSLRKADMSLLKDKNTISFNRAYISYEEWGFDPTYYMIIDPFLFCSTLGDINNLIKTNKKIKKFIFKKNKEVSLDPKTMQLINRPGIDCSVDDIIEDNRVESIDMVGGDYFLKEGKISYFGSVGLCSLQILYKMGYKKVYLVGCDMGYNDKIEDTKWNQKGNFLESSSDEGDNNHYRSDYFGEGIKYGKPYNRIILEKWEKVYHKIRGLKNFEVISLTPNSQLNDFINFEESDIYK
tara:strand:+ start:493 stop:1383 length:891 start_codon:yes stop_codon:yes gene_type:complete